MSDYPERCPSCDWELPNHDPDAVCGEPSAPDLLVGLRNGKWLDAQVFPPLRFVVPGLIPEGFTLLVGAPKVGKSWMVLNIALALAQGGKALGGLTVGDPRPVFYLALEDGDRRLQDRCRTLLDDAPIPEGFEYLTRVRPDRLLLTVEQWLDRHPGSDAVVFLDTLGKVMRPARPGETNYDRDYRTGGNIKELTDSHPGASVNVVHHDRKAVADDYVDSVSGTNGLAGSADSVVVLSRRRGETDGLLQVTGRDVAEREYAMTTEGGRWRISGADLDTAARTAAVVKQTLGLDQRALSIVQIVAEHPDGITTGEVAQFVGITSTEASVYLGRLANSGRIRKIRRGLYSSP